MEATARLDDVVECANLLVTATTVKQPLVQAGEVRPGTTLCALGSFEFSPEVYQQVDKLVVDDWRQTSVAHDVRPMLESGVLSADRVHAEIAEIVTGSKPGRQDPDETILVRTEGLASQDISLAHWVYEESRRNGLGVEL